MQAQEHLLIGALFGLLPEPGSEWPRDQREAWIDLARAIFKVLYTTPPTLRCRIDGCERAADPATMLCTPCWRDSRREDVLR